MSFVITFNSNLHDVTSIEHYVGQSIISFFHDVASRNVMWLIAVHRCMNLVGPK